MSNLVERAAWTAVEAAAGAVVVMLADQSALWIPIIATALSALKTFAQQKRAASVGA